MRALSLIWVLLWASVPVLAQGVPAQRKHARLELLSTQDASSKQALLGVHFVLEKGWHVYWINPGDSGQPPSFTWDLPAGFSTGEILWPIPHRLQNSPTIADYGYQDDVLFIVPLQLPPSWKPANEAAIELHAKWLICREICIPDQEDLKLSWQESRPSAPVAQLFSRTRNLLPQPWPKGWIAKAESRKDDFLLAIEARGSISAAEFFPLDPGQVENAAKQPVQPTAHGAKIVLRKSDLLLKPLLRLRGVLVIPGRGAYQLQAPVVAQAAVK